MVAVGFGAGGNIYQLADNIGTVPHSEGNWSTTVTVPPATPLGAYNVGAFCVVDRMFWTLYNLVPITVYLQQKAKHGGVNAPQPSPATEGVEVTP